MRLFCVTGMHRSGTSLAARILNLLGVDLGPEEAMMGATEHNPRGYWEVEAISDLDDDVIEHLGGRWHRLPPFDPGWEQDGELSPFRRRAREILDEVFGDAGLAGFKDPRLSLLLPFWATLTSIDGTVLVLRHPDEVAGSIGRRDGFGTEKAASLWLDHVAAAWINDPARVAVTYDDLLADPVGQAGRIAERLDLPAPDDDAAEAIAAFADPDLRRSGSFEPGGVGPELAAARSLWGLITGPAADTHLDAVMTQLWQSRNRGRILERDLREAGDELGYARRDLRTALRERDEARGRLDELRADHRHQMERLQREVSRARRRAEEAEATARRRAHEIQQAERAAERWQMEYDRVVNRRAVKAALGVAGAFKPLIQGLRRLRGAEVNPGRGGTGTRAGGDRAGEGATGEVGEAPARHEPAGEEEAAEMARRLRADAPGSERTEGPPVSILVLNRDGAEHLRRLLPGLADTTYRFFELIVVDNDSSDDSVELLGGADIGAEVTVIENDHNASFSEGNNQALAAAGGTYVLLLNNDIEPASPGWLGHMVDTLEESQETLAVGARLVYPRRPGLDNAGDTVHPDLTLQHRGVHFDSGVDGVPRGRNLGAGEDPTSAEAAAVVERPAVTAACMLLRRDVLEDVGGLTSGYRYGTEDVDLCLKLRERGGRIVYDGQAVLWHHEYGTQNERGREIKRQNRLHNRELFVDLWGPRLTRQVLLDKLRGDRSWSLEALHVAITVTKDDPDAGWGDYYTAHELGDALADLGFLVSYVERYDERWYDLDDTVDVLLVLIDAYELPRAPRTVTTVAWVRNWTERWIGRDWFADYDLVLASSHRSKELIGARTATSAHLFPLATNPDRFSPDGPTGPGCDAIFAGNYWDKPRDIIPALTSLPAGLDVRVHGSNWEQVDGVARFDHGPVDYTDLPAVYRGAAAVVDDTAEHTLPYRAVNSRVFDALASATPVITDNPEGIAEIFGGEAAEDFPIWTDGESLRDHIEWVRANPEQAAARVERWREVVLAEHTYARRATQLKDLLEEWITARRVTIAIGVPDRGELHQWGDTHFARDLQDELEARGHPTRVLILPEWDTAHRSRDDVLLHLFGLSELTTRRGQANLLWNISHPELVDADLVDRYDLAFTAGRSFAEQLDRKTAIEVAHLPQATDPDRFRPDPGGAPHHELLFVGNSRKVRRRIVDDVTALLEAGLDAELAIYGADWTSDLVDQRWVRGDHVDNDELGSYYAAADVVLNDHWDGMRDHGFLSNRLYDALAAGAFVVSDHVDGIEEAFDGAVATYRDRGELREILERHLGDPDARAERAGRGRAAVLDRHTFADRVETLLAAAGGVLPPALIVAGDDTAARAPDSDDGQ